MPGTCSHLTALFGELTFATGLVSFTEQTQPNGLITVLVHFSQLDTTIDPVYPWPRKVR